MNKQTILLLLVLLGNILFGQDNSKDFEKYAHTQDSLCMQAYDKHDDKKYEKLLSEFLVKYNKLNDADKKDFKGTLNDIYYNLCCLYSLQNNKIKALDNLELSVKFGYNSYKHTTEDTDLDNIRNEDRFKTLSDKMRLTGDYTYIVELARIYDKGAKVENEKYLSAVRKFESLVDNNFKEMKFPAEYASLMNITERHLNRITKTCLNKTPTEIISERVMLEAKRILIHSNQSIAEVAGELGYFDSSYFSKLFKKRTKLTPNQFLERNH